MEGKKYRNGEKGGKLRYWGEIKRNFLCRLCHSEGSLRSEESVDVGKKEVVIVDTDSSSYRPQNDRNSILKEVYGVKNL